MGGLDIRGVALRNTPPLKNTPPRFWPDRQLGGVFLSVADCLAEEPISGRRRRAALRGRGRAERPQAVLESQIRLHFCLKTYGAAELPPHYNTTARPMGSTITISCGSGQAARQS